MILPMKKIPLILLLYGVISYSYCQKIVNLSEAKKAVEDYYYSGQYHVDLQKALNEAKEEIEKLKLSKNSTVVFDVDETTLSNYEIIKKLDFGYEHSIWDAWVLQAKASAIPEVKKFYEWVVSKKIKIIFLSGRDSIGQNATIKNLKEQGYTTFDTLITRAPAQSHLLIAEFKELEREKLAKEGYDIIACVGDQWSDLKGKFTGIKVKLPNYMYIIN